IRHSGGGLCLFAEHLFPDQKVFALFLDPLFLYELADLATDRLQHVQQLLIGMERALGKKLNHAANLASGFYRKSYSALETCGRGNGSTRKIIALQSVLDPDWCRTRPNTSGKSDTVLQLGAFRFAGE